MKITIPKTFAEFQDGSAMAEVERVLNALANHQIQIRLPDGTILRGTMQMSGENAVTDIKPFGSGGAPVVANAQTSGQAPIIPPIPATQGGSFAGV